MLNLITAYRFDKHGYYVGTDMIMPDMVPTDDTLVAPELKDGYWSKFDTSSNTWDLEKIPTTCQELIDGNYSVVSNSSDPHDRVVADLMRVLVQADPEHYKIDVAADLVMTVAVVPPKTVEEVRAEKLAAFSTYANQFDQYKCNEMYVISSVGGYKFNADIRSQTNMQGLIDVMTDDTTLYKDYGNEFRTMTKSDLITLKEECLKNGQNLYQQKWHMQNKINACKTVDELNAIELKFEMIDFTPRMPVM